MTEQMRERVAVYMRVSSDEQRDRETIEIQRDFLAEYCRLYGLEVVDTLTEEPALQGYLFDGLPSPLTLVTGVFCVISLSLPVAAGAVDGVRGMAAGWLGAVAVTAVLAWRRTAATGDRG